jgi:glyoxylase-like metal-dependent hydrolase (beta-lactamase superfamily II)
MKGHMCYFITDKIGLLIVGDVHAGNFNSSKGPSDVMALPNERIEMLVKIVPILRIP